MIYNQYKANNPFQFIKHRHFCITIKTCRLITIFHSLDKYKDYLVRSQWHCKIKYENDTPDTDNWEIKLPDKGQLLNRLQLSGLGQLPKQF